MVLVPVPSKGRNGGYILHAHSCHFQLNTALLTSINRHYITLYPSFDPMVVPPCLSSPQIPQFMHTDQLRTPGSAHGCVYLRFPRASWRCVQLRLTVFQCIWSSIAQLSIRDTPFCIALRRGYVAAKARYVRSKIVGRSCSSRIGIFLGRCIS